jgi:hypothetical protein
MVHVIKCLGTKVPEENRPGKYLNFGYLTPNTAAIAYLHILSYNAIYTPWHLFPTTVG